jgi:hypothetical protein
MKCSICETEIPVKDGGWSQGNSAEPVNHGRCCDDCNMSVVVPARMKELCDRQAAWQDESEEEPEHWLYLLNHGGFERVVGEADNWSTAHQLTGETGRLFAAAPEMLTTLRDLRREMKAGSILDAGNIETWIRELDAVIAKAERRDV